MLKGKVHKYGANVDTDVIIPARYLSLSEPDELAEHCMEDIDAEFVKRVKPGDLIVASPIFQLMNISFHEIVCHLYLNINLI